MVVTVGGTLAWLTDVTEKVENVFTTSNVDIELDETKAQYKMVPGVEIAKDPKVTVIEGSEACYVFIKVEYTPDKTTFDKYMTYSFDGWTELPGVANVYYKEVPAATTGDVEFAVLTGNKLTVKNDVTNAMMDEVDEGANLKMTFTAYAIQQAGMSGVADAWTKISSVEYETPAGSTEGTKKDAAPANP